MKRFVTAMSLAQYNDYGKPMIDSFLLHWPSESLWVYSEDKLPVSLEDQLAGRIVVERLQDVLGWKEFMALCDHSPVFKGVVDGYENYRYNARAFANKAFAQCAAANEYAGCLFWIDADVLTEKPIAEAWLDQCLEGVAMCVMKRKTWHLCSSFVGWDCSHPITQAFFQNYYSLYAGNTIFCLPEWHDAYIVEMLISQCSDNIRDIGKNISGEGPYNVFDSVFEGKAKHFKGNKKNRILRYDQLTEIVKNRQPKRIIEIGTWNGDRALLFHQVSPDSEYIGFDLFEEATAETDQDEKNVKKHFSQEDVRKKLSDAGMTFTLYKGDTRKTVGQYLKSHQAHSADLIFIDGGHSVDTIRSDLAFARDAITKDGVIVMDDYYTGMSDDELSQFGCQAVLEGDYMVLPVKDRVHGGGFVQMAIC